ncbi:MAG: hypothetical protein A2086_04190 [Spirochaetes bacterium GWD1_27_9]|nr:MAG: hypothetical protein A2Z98_17985 [Spirochaetes bacterium GWB1_27_13]OHD23050.1 MAG: hypothetical protein A2Y34_17875 [Spirochaetes bacterium GWC1_27_15]OHD41359.1 MAG: hypothetical protein A2086_04190 [Spirochaetes bacterium GWD1_27_9]
MNKRIFSIDEKCFIIYTGKSSADNKSFLRIGNSEFITKNIQSHIRHIVVPDASTVDAKLEKDNIKYMEKGKISYICNKKNQDILFKSLASVGVDTENLYHKDLSKELENINRIENKKHFFTIFYENKNLKLVFNEEIFFDLFSFMREKWDFKQEQQRLNDFVDLIDDLYNQNKNKDFLDTILDSKLPLEIDFEYSSIFLIQENHYFPLNIGMFNIERQNKSGDFKFNFNCSQRFLVGKEISIFLLEKEEKKIELAGILLDGEVIESEVLYKYTADFKLNENNNSLIILQFYKYLCDKAKSKL